MQSEEARMLQKIHDHLVRAECLVEDRRAVEQYELSERQLLQTIVFQNRDKIWVLQYIAAILTVCTLKLLGVF